ncbi:MAG: Regulator of chromosome condensation (RCC1) repeat protein [Parcubacteria group bacterium ADurb.Bin192]|nr:MAG: Regulator of chromosome condensation (RCC1) repeat protein [Parcubacteria group bacterium ADurb.Bin192]
MRKMLLCLFALILANLNCGSGEGQKSPVAPTDAGTDEQETAPTGCQPGDKKCSGLTAQLCDSDRIWQEVETCPYVCLDGECLGECQAGDRRCDGLTPQLCSQQNKWEDQTVCEFQCLNGECVGECQPGDKKCSGLTAQLCDSDRIWQEVETCPYVCLNGECVGECQTGDKRCDGLTPQLCSQQNEWEDQTVCEFQCLNGECVGECQPGDKRCDNNIAQTCGTNHTWQDDVCSSATCLCCDGNFVAGAKMISAGRFHTCGLSQDGKLYCWGANHAGQILPSGYYNSYETPLPISFLGEGIRYVSTGYRNSCAIKQDQTVWCWGKPDRSIFQLNTLGTNVSEISMGPEHACALKSDGTVWCWGNNEYGQVAGNGTFGGVDLPPTQVTTLGSNVSQVTVGAFHSCALKSDGTVWCWGHNYFGEVGDSTLNEQGESCLYGYKICRLTPVQIASLSGQVLQIAGGTYNTCALKSNGTVWCWGINDQGQLGDGTNTGQACGYNKTHVCKPSPVQVNLTDQAIFVANSPSSTASGTGWSELGHACAIKQDGTLWCWGANYYGQLGDGTTTVRSTPVPVTTLGNQVASLSLGGGNDTYGGGHSCAIKLDGSLWCWGSNFYGMLGDGTEFSQSIPIPVYPGCP